MVSDFWPVFVVSMGLGGQNKNGRQPRFRG
jgi:hypothetical protein